IPAPSPVRDQPGTRGCGVAVRDRLRKDAAQYLQPGEQVQAVFYAKRPTMQYNDRAVVATDRRLLLLRLNFLGRATGLAGEVPREPKLGPCSGFMHPIDAFGISLAVSFRFFKRRGRSGSCCRLLKSARPVLRRTFLKGCWRCGEKDANAARYSTVVDE